VRVQYRARELSNIRRVYLASSVKSVLQRVHYAALKVDPIFKQDGERASSRKIEIFYDSIFFFSSSFPFPINE